MNTLWGGPTSGEPGEPGKSAQNIYYTPSHKTLHFVSTYRPPYKHLCGLIVQAYKVIPVPREPLPAAPVLAAKDVRGRRFLPEGALG